MIPGFDRRLLGRRFGRAAKHYAQIAVLQREVESRLLDGIETIAQAPAVVLDVGTGPGRASAVLRRRYPGAKVIALDLALPMLHQARRQGGWFRPLPVLCADAAALPLAQDSIDLLFSSLCLQWLDDPMSALLEFQRVLRPEGWLRAATFGPDTLTELRQAWAAADDHPHVSDFPPMAVLGDALIAQGFRDPVLDRDHFSLSYASLDDLLSELRGIGAANARRDRSRGLAGKSAWKRMRECYADQFRDAEGRFVATYEVISLQARGAQPGQPRRSGHGEIASIPISAIRRRPRSGG